MLKTFSNHLNIEIQQRACEFMQILEPKWDSERKEIFDPMPFKGDENMLVDAKDRMALDQDEGENQLLIGFDDEKPKTKQDTQSNNVLDLDLMLGDTPSTTV